MFKTTVLICSVIVGAMILLQGCTGLSKKQKNLPNVTSSPTGATVYADLLELGKTPLRHNLYEAFPASWQNSVYQARGVLIVKMDGCKDFTLKVSDFILSKPIHAELKCSGVVKPEKTTPVPEQAEKPAEAPKVTASSGTEKRLEDLSTLLKKGVITDEEYKKTRERILNEL